MAEGIGPPPETGGKGGKVMYKLVEGGTKGLVWTGGAPGDCDFCKSEFLTGFYDAKTKHGPWAFMCGPCFTKHGVGLGIGAGQKYEKEG